jgi:peptidoglycan/LPS O-acetylase OafA/YrhL
MSEFRNRLMDIEPLSAERNAKLKQEIQAMFEQKMSRWEKVYWGASAAGSLVFAVCAIPIVFFAPVTTNVRMIWGVFGVINALVAAFLLWRIRNGSMNLPQQFAAGKASVGVTMLITTLLLINATAHPTLENLVWSLFGVTWVVAAAAIAVHNRVMAAELNSREQVLKLEYRLAELAEKLGQRA